MTISKTASKNVAFKVSRSRLNESALESQKEVRAQKAKEEKTENEDDKQAFQDIDIYRYRI